ncbi:STAS domain-containing protein [Maridesulfovibrio ferrireducens]|uniref:STAS domain-containing protein n=1 Tax=Maridesulfovibrio ferrireducens TaxID=246191 RepID=UPI001A1AD972|nr:STAS domain-containing protein [Maridesulfovibrio ferrireducens]MBI9111219.1 STAS domain-containing protein [Maridesulfovibrio ferrireducens]
MSFGWKLDVSAEEALIKISGEIDFTGTPALREELHKFIEISSGEVRVDLSELEYLDSSGLASLIELRRMLTQKDRTVVIISVTEQVDKLLHLTQVKSLFGME